MIRGETAKVLRPIDGEPDEMGEPVIIWESETVDNVLIQPSSNEDLDETRPDGDKLTVTFHFPKTYTASLRGCRVEYAGVQYEVIGNPIGYMIENTPTPWNRSVKAWCVDG